jgi:hypothetical protein
VTSLAGSGVLLLLGSRSLQLVLAVRHLECLNAAAYVYCVQWLAVSLALQFK